MGAWEVGNKVKFYRQKKSWSQDELARAAGVSRPAIIRLEHEKTSSIKTMRAIAAAFELNFKTVFPNFK